MGIDDITGGVRTLSRTLNGSKKKIAVHGTAHGVTSLATIAIVVAWINTNYGPLAGLKDIPELHEKADTTVEVATKVGMLEGSIEKLEKKLDQVLDLQIQAMQKQNMQPRIEKQVVVDHYPVPKNDRTAVAFWKHGAAVDTLMVPQYIVDDSL